SAFREAPALSRARRSPDSAREWRHRRETDRPRSRARPAAAWRKSCGKSWGTPRPRQRPRTRPRRRPACHREKRPAVEARLEAADVEFGAGIAQCLEVVAIRQIEAAGREIACADQQMAGAVDAPGGLDRRQIG